jgi:hypothetical protein
MYAALGLIAEKSLSEFVTYIEMNPDKFQVDVNLQGTSSQAEMDNLGSSAIHNISIFYDHCYQWASAPGSVSSISEVQAVSMGSKAIQIIRDLDNKEKHPHQTPSLSGFTPVLENVFRCLAFTDSLEVSQYYSGEVKFAGDISYILTGTVRNTKTQEEIGQLDTILDDAVTAWELFLTRKGLLALTNTEPSTAPDEKRSVVFAAPMHKPLEAQQPLETLHYLLVAYTLCTSDKSRCITAIQLYTVIREGTSVQELRLYREKFVEFRDPTQDVDKIGLWEAVLTVSRTPRIPGARTGIFATGEFAAGIKNRVEPILNDVHLPADMTFVSPSTDQGLNRTLANLESLAVERALRMAGTAHAAPEGDVKRELPNQKPPYRFSREWFANPALAALK